MKYLLLIFFMCYVSFYFDADRGVLGVVFLPVFLLVSPTTRDLSLTGDFAIFLTRVH